MRTVRVLATVVAAGCATHTAAPTLANHAPPAARPAPIARGLHVTGGDRTGGGGGDLVEARALQAFGGIPGAGAVPAIDLDVELTALTGPPAVSCKLTILATRDQSMIATASGGATVTPGDGPADVDCIDAALASLRPKIAQLVADRMDDAGRYALAEPVETPRVRLYELDADVYQGDAPGGVTVAVEQVLNKSMIRREVRDHGRAFEHCYATTPGVEGTVTVQLAIMPDGTVRGARATTSVAPALDACVVEVFEHVAFPASDGVTEVLYPITFRAPAAG